MDPDTLNLDPGPEFWPNLDPDPGLSFNFEKKDYFRDKQFFLNNLFIKLEENNSTRST